MDLNDEVAKCKKNGWLDVWMAFETVAINKETVENALKIHIEKIGKSKNKDVILYEKNIGENLIVKEVPDHIKKKMPENAELWSQVANVKIVVKDMFSLMNIIIVYGPSAVEIHGPNSRTMKLDEMQNVASAGVGGVVISSERG